MYKHILLPVDGSEFGMGSVPYALGLAKSIGARITAIHVTAPYETVAIGALRTFLAPAAEPTPQPSEGLQHPLKGHGGR